MQSSLLPPADGRAATEAGQSSGADASSDSGKKRKAEKEAAPSPLPALPLATSLAKRRQSPPVEARSSEPPNHSSMQPSLFLSLYWRGLGVLLWLFIVCIFLIFPFKDKFCKSCRWPAQGPCSESGAPGAQACTTDQENVNDRRSPDVQPAPDNADPISFPDSRPGLVALGRQLGQSALGHEDPDATVPLINNKLALRAIAGRQSICPSKPIEVNLSKLSKLHHAWVRMTAPLSQNSCRHPVCWHDAKPSRCSLTRHHTVETACIWHACPYDRAETSSIHRRSSNYFYASASAGTCVNRQESISCAVRLQHLVAR